MASPIHLLKQACQSNSLSTNTSLSNDDKTITIFGSAHDAKASQTLTLNNGKGGAKASYTLASIYLLLLNPSVLPYRKACDAGGVVDPVKILDKKSILEYFFDGGGSETDDGSEKADDAMDMSDDDEMATPAEDDTKKDTVQFSQSQVISEEKRGQGHSKEHHQSGGGRDRERDRVGSRGGRDKDMFRDLSRHREGHRSQHQSRSRKEEEEGHVSRKNSGKGSKAPMVPITNEQLVANLSTIVDKRNKTGAGAATTPSNEHINGQEDSIADYGKAEVIAAVAKDDHEEAAATPMDSRQTTPATTHLPIDGDEREGATLSLLNEDVERREREERKLLLSWLSPVGFQGPVVAAAIEANREAVRRITASEIPVGDSASILRAGAGGDVVDRAAEVAAAVASPAGGNVKKRDFARVLNIYQEVTAAEERARHRAAGNARAGRKRPPPPPQPSRLGRGPRASAGATSSAIATGGVGGHPIIVVPNAMTSVITMVNVGAFLGRDAVYRREGPGRRGGTITLTHRFSARLGGHEVTFDVIDNPATRLKKDEWHRVVAVLCQGARWQFKGWRYSDPVDLFSRTFGFYVGLEGANVPSELRGWKVKTGKVSRDRRGGDSICLASFWNGLEEFMAVHKQEFFK